MTEAFPFGIFLDNDLRIEEYVALAQKAESRSGSPTPMKTSLSSRGLYS